MMLFNAHLFLIIHALEEAFIISGFPIGRIIDIHITDQWEPHNIHHNLIIE